MSCFFYIKRDQIFIYLPLSTPIKGQVWEVSFPAIQEVYIQSATRSVYAPRQLMVALVKSCTPPWKTWIRPELCQFCRTRTTRLPKFSALRQPMVALCSDSDVLTAVELSTLFKFAKVRQLSRCNLKPSGVNFAVLGLPFCPNFFAPRQPMVALRL